MTMSRAECQSTNRLLSLLLHVRQQMNQARITLLASGRMHWRSFLPAWIFPVVFLLGGVVSEQLGHPHVFFWGIAAPLFFWSYFRAAQVPLSLPHIAFWVVLVPFVIWAVAVYARLLVLYFVGSANAI